MPRIDCLGLAVFADRCTLGNDVVYQTSVNPILEYFLNGCTNSS